LVNNNFVKGLFINFQIIVPIRETAGNVTSICWLFL
jgi:hypothetical protein